jgi:putative endonuclease
MNFRTSKSPCVYVLASAPNGVLYIGVTSDLHHRMAQHDQGLFEGFTKTYGVKQLVYYEFFETMPDAIGREKRLKEWQRAWKVRLIKGANPEWRNLFDPLTGEISPLPSDPVRTEW